MPRQSREVRDIHTGVMNCRGRFTSIRIDAVGETPHLARATGEEHSGAAPNPVTRLWTGCTRLKKQIVAPPNF